MIVLRFKHDYSRYIPARDNRPKHERPLVKEWLVLHPDVRVIQSFDYKFNSILAFSDEELATEFILKFGKES